MSTNSPPSDSSPHRLPSSLVDEIRALNNEKSALAVSGPSTEPAKNSSVAPEKQNRLPNGNGVYRHRESILVPGDSIDDSSTCLPSSCSSTSFTLSSLSSSLRCSILSNSVKDDLFKSLVSASQGSYDSRDQKDTPSSSRTTEYPSPPQWSTTVGQAASSSSMNHTTSPDSLHGCADEGFQLLPTSTSQSEEMNTMGLCEWVLERLLEVTPESPNPDEQSVTPEKTKDGSAGQTATTDEETLLKNGGSSLETPRSIASRGTSVNASPEQSQYPWLEWDEAEEAAREDSLRNLSFNAVPYDAKLVSNSLFKEDLPCLNPGIAESRQAEDAAEINLNRAAMLAAKFDVTTVDFNNVPAELLQAIPRAEDGSLLSVGSIPHERGTCKPCVFYRNVKKGGCVNGMACLFCHLKHPPHRRPPRPSKRHRMMQRALRLLNEAKSENDALSDHVGPPPPKDAITATTFRIAPQASHLDPVSESEALSINNSERTKSLFSRLIQQQRLLAGGAPDGLQQFDLNLPTAGDINRNQAIPDHCFNRPECLSQLPFNNAKQSRVDSHPIHGNGDPSAKSLLPLEATDEAHDKSNANARQWPPDVSPEYAAAQYNAWAAAAREWTKSGHDDHALLANAAMNSSEWPLVSVPPWMPSPRHPQTGVCKFPPFPPSDQAMRDYFAMLAHHFQRRIASREPITASGLPQQYAPDMPPLSAYPPFSASSNTIPSSLPWSQQRGRPSGGLSCVKLPPPPPDTPTYGAAHSPSPSRGWSGFSPRVPLWPGMNEAATPPPISPNLAAGPRGQWIGSLRSLPLRSNQKGRSVLLDPRQPVPTPQASDSMAYPSYLGRQ